MTLGSAAAPHLRFLVWCKACCHGSEPSPPEQARSCMDDRAGLGQAARVLAMRQPECRLCGERDEAPVKRTVPKIYFKADSADDRYRGLYRCSIRSPQSKPIRSAP